MNQQLRSLRRLSPTDWASIHARWQSAQHRANQQAKQNITKFSKIAQRQVIAQTLALERTVPLAVRWALEEKQNQTKHLEQHPGYELSGKYVPGDQQTNLSTSPLITGSHRIRFLLDHFILTGQLSQSIERRLQSVSDCKDVIMELLKLKKMHAAYAEHRVQIHNLFRTLFEKITQPQQRQFLMTHLIEYALHDLTGKTLDVVQQRECILTLFHFSIDRTTQSQIFSQHLFGFAMLMDKYDFNQFLLIHYTFMKRHFSLRGCLQTEFSQSKLNHLGLTRLAALSLGKMSENKEFYYRPYHWLIIKDLIDTLQTSRIDQNWHPMLTKYINAFIEHLSDSRTSIQQFFEWLSLFIFAPPWYQKQIVANFKNGVSLQDEIDRIKAFEKTQIINLILIPSDWKEHPSQFHKNPDQEQELKSIFDSTQQTPTGKALLKKWKDDGTLDSLVNSLRFVGINPITNIDGRDHIMDFISQAYQSHERDFLVKKPSRQNFPGPIQAAWQDDFEKTYTPNHPNDLRTLQMEALFQLETFFNFKEIPSITIEYPKTQISTLIKMIMDFRKFLQQPQINPDQWIEAKAKIKTLLNTFKPHREYLRSFEFSVQFNFDRLFYLFASILAFIERYENKKSLAPGSYTFKITGHHETMLRTGLEPSPNCLTTDRQTLANASGIAFVRSQFDTYKTMVIERRHNNTTKLVSFADLEIRQLKTGTYLLVDYFYSELGFLDSLRLREQIKDYAETVLKIPRQNVIFADKNRINPTPISLQAIDFKFPRKAPLDQLDEFLAYRDNFRLNN